MTSVRLRSDADLSWPQFKWALRLVLRSNRGVMAGRKFDVYEFDTFGVFRLRVVSSGHETDLDFYKTTGAYRIWIDGVLAAPELN